MEENIDAGAPPGAREAAAAPATEPALDERGTTSSDAPLQVDGGIRQALADRKFRDRVLEIEQQVRAFIDDKSAPTLEFPASFTSYERMLAHRVAQFFGLETTTLDWDKIAEQKESECTSRVQASRTDTIRCLEVQLAELDVSDVVVPAAANGSRKAGAASLLKRPPGSQPAGMSGQPGASAFARRAARSAEDAEAEYARARERIMGVALPGEASDVSVGPSSSAGSYGVSSSGQRGTGAYLPSTAAALGGRGGRGSKAMLHNRQRDMQDPDYHRDSRGGGGGGSGYPGNYYAGGDGYVYPGGFMYPGAAVPLPGRSPVMGGPAGAGGAPMGMVPGYRQFAGFVPGWGYPAAQMAMVPDMGAGMYGYGYPAMSGGLEGGAYGAYPCMPGYPQSMGYGGGYGFGGHKGGRRSRGGSGGRRGGGGFVSKVGNGEVDVAPSPLDTAEGGSTASASAC